MTLYAKKWNSTPKLHCISPVRNGTNDPANRSNYLKHEQICIFGSALFVKIVYKADKRFFAPNLEKLFEQHHGLLCMLGLKLLVMLLVV